MSELITDMHKKRELLKEMILRLHSGEAVDVVRTKLAKLLGEVPYGIVVGVEQELIQEGLPAEEVLQLCDIHGQALKGMISLKDAKSTPEGHPVHTFKMENRMLSNLISRTRNVIDYLANRAKDDELHEIIRELRLLLNSLSDVDKHYRRKENLLFPYLEKHGITGPPKVMWGKHDEARAYMKEAISKIIQLEEQEKIDRNELKNFLESSVVKTLDAIDEMIYKEEEILFPTCLDVLSEEEWYSIVKQSPEIGFCLYDPKDEWKPSNIQEVEREEIDYRNGRITLPSGVLSVEELITLFNTLPVDITFVDKDDYVRYFSQGRERIFDRNRAILGRKVQLCHPPSSVHIVEKILSDFKSGKKDRARFWLNVKGRFVYIEYIAMRDKSGEYLGTLEVTEDLTEKRSLEGERRILNYD